MGGKSMAHERVRRLGWIWRRAREPRRLAAAVLGAGLLLGVGAARVQAQVPLRFELGAGAAFPSTPGAANFYWDVGYTLSAGTRWRLDTHWNVGLDVGFAHFNTHVPDAAPPEDSFPGALHVIPILLAGEYAFSDWSNTRPFVSAHAGYVRVRAADPSIPGGGTPPPQPDSDAFGLGFGIGVRTLLTASTDLVLDAGWRVALADPDRIAWIPVRLAVRF